MREKYVVSVYYARDLCILISGIGVRNKRFVKIIVKGIDLIFEGSVDDSKGLSLSLYWENDRYVPSIRRPFCNFSNISLIFIFCLPSFFKILFKLTVKLYFPHSIVSPQIFIN